MRFFIVCPAYIATGGTELLHQFSKCLTDNNIENYMIYRNSNGVNCPTPPTFSKYDVKYVSSYVDARDSVLVLPETQIHCVDWCQKGIAMIWWLSVDNYLSSYNNQIRVNNVDIFKLKERDNAVHFVQSHYAKFFVENKLGIVNSYFLMDYINDEIVEFAKENVNYKDRQNICIYNPKKGYEKMKPVIDACRKDITWVPLIGLKPSEISKLMSISKLYVDFGHHPGKDRIPREAAICGCCVLTNKKGSAAFKEDVNIPERYKVNNVDDIDDVLNKVYDLVDNYEERKFEYSNYRESIASEKNEFITDLNYAIDILRDRINIRNAIIERNVDPMRYQKTYKIIEGAIDKMKELLISSQYLYENNNSYEAVAKLLTMDYIMQIVCETTYAQISEISNDEE